MADGRYFQTNKKGEIPELRSELHASSKEKKKEAVKRVIAAMTVNKDVSSLFPDVVNCMQTTNIELKKLVYLYVINYARTQPELAILAVNTFRKDSQDSNPLIRALAVRTMGCIRLEQITEYLVEPLKRCCKDQDPYVRKTASMCIAKLYDISPSMVKSHGFIDTLLAMLGDSNPMVVANSVAALSEISEASGTHYLKDVINSSDQSVSKLIAALNECTEWGQVFILDALVLYDPNSPQDAESVLDRVTARLSHANSAVVLSAVKVVMKLLNSITDVDVVRNIQRKLCPPLITLLSTEPEIQYVALRNINLIVQKRPSILSTEIKMFFCKYNDPVYVKTEKIDIMVRLASERNVDRVLMEMKEYATEVDVAFVRNAVRAIGRCAIKIESASERCIGVLLDLIETRVNYVIQEAIVVIKDIFRKYPNRYESVISALCENLDSLDEAEAKSAMIWIIGEYAERINNADELMEHFVESFYDESASVQLQILTSTVKLFLKKSSNTQELVTRVLKMSTEDCDNPDVRDRAYIYWRLLSRNPEAARKVILSDKPAISNDAFSIDYVVLDLLLENISMVASVYHKTPDSFITRIRSRNVEDEDDDSEGDEESDEDKVERIQEALEKQYYVSDDEKEVSSPTKGAVRNTDSDEESEGQGSDGDSVDLLGFEDDHSSDESPNASQPIDYILVLDPQKPGTKGKSGLKIYSSIISTSAGIKIHFKFHNATNSPLSGWALQINKNPFGLSPSTNIPITTIAASSFADCVLELKPNQANSNLAPSHPLLLQVAVKCNLDVFYFTVPYDFSVVLQKGFSTDTQNFHQKWLELGEAKQASFMAKAKQNVSSELLTSVMQKRNFSLVFQRTAETFDTIYFTSKTTNNLTLLLEVSLQKNGTGVKIVVRTEASALVPLVRGMFQELFTLTYV